jgi:hypothetical protein
MSFTNLVLLVFMSALAIPVATAQGGDSFSAEHLAAAERMVYALGIPESLSIPTRRVIQQVREKDPVRAKVMSSAFEPYLDKKYVADGLKEFIAGQLDNESCRQIAEFWEGPVGRRFVSTQVELLMTGKAPKLVFTPDEETMMKRFEKTGAFHAFNRAMPAIQARIAEFAKDLQARMGTRFKEELRKNGGTLKN